MTKFRTYFVQAAVHIRESEFQDLMLPANTAAGARGFVRAIFKKVHGAKKACPLEEGETVEGEGDNEGSRLESALMRAFGKVNKEIVKVDMEALMKSHGLDTMFPFEVLLV